MALFAITGLGSLCRETSGTDGRVLEQATSADEWFQVERYLSAKETKYMPKAPRMAVAAASLALEDRQMPSTEELAAAGVVVGTNFAATRTIADIDTTALNQGASAVRPLDSPYFSINLSASHVSIKYGMRAFNITLTAPVVAGIESVAVACRTLSRRRTKLALAGAIEADPPVEPALDAGTLESGACMIVLEPIDAVRERGGTAYALINGHLCAFVDPAVASDLASAEARADEIACQLAPLLAGGDDSLPVLVAGPQTGAVGQIGRWAIKRALASAGRTMEVRRGLGADGRHATVSPVLALADMARTSGSAGLGLVFAASPQGHLVFVTISRPNAELMRLHATD